MPGQVPPLSLPPQMLLDLAKVSEAPLAQLRQVAAALGQENGVMSVARLYEIVESVFGETDAAQAVGNTVYSINPENPDRIIADLRAAQAHYPSPPLTDAALDQLRPRLAALAVPYPALDRLRKADRLRRMVGNWFQSADLLCDLRPIFDKTRTQIEGMIPIQILRISHVDKDGNGAVFEISLDGDDVNELIEKLSLGKQKTAALKRSCEEWVPGGWAATESASRPESE